MTSLLLVLFSFPIFFFSFRFVLFYLFNYISKSILMTMIIKTIVIITIIILIIIIIKRRRIRMRIRRKKRKFGFFKFFLLHFLAKTFPRYCFIWTWGRVFFLQKLIHQAINDSVRYVHQIPGVSNR